MNKLAESSGTIIYENENRLHIVKKTAQWTSTFMFVTGLLAFILLTNGILQLFFFNKQIPELSTLGIILSALGLLFLLIFWRIIAYRKKLNTNPLNELKCICILDFSTNNLLDAQQNILSPINNILLVRKMQITSSSPELVLNWGNKSLSIAKGNPFSGGISSVEKFLISKGIQRQ